MRTLWLSLLRFAPLPLTVILANLAIDPVRVAGGDAYERGIASMLVAGRGVTNIFNPKDAAVVQSVIETLPHGPDVIVLGSSRSKLVRARLFATTSFFNNSVAGGSVTDYLAIYALYRERGFTPKLAVVEVSPWVLEPAYKSIWEARYPPKRDLEQALLNHQPLATTNHVSVSDSLVRVRELISPGYFQTSLMTWVLWTRQGASRTTYFEYHAGDVPLGETQLPDGSVIYPELLLKEAEREKIRAAAIAYAGGSTGVPRAISPERVAILEALVRRLEDDGAKVLLYLPPYHPVTYDHMVSSEAGRLLPDVERTLHEIATRTGAETIGSFDPRRAGFGEDDFFDPSHPNADAVARLFSGRAGSLASASGSHGAAATPAAPEQTIRIASIQNPNGLETVDGRPFFWIGQGTSCISLKASAAGWARVGFDAIPGPGLPETPKRRLIVTSSASPQGQSQIATVDTLGPFSVIVPVGSGVTEACFTPLDRATVLRQANGDTRPLLLGASAPRVEAVAAPATSPTAAAAPCRVAFTRGWYLQEGDRTNWHRWMSGAAELTINADVAGNAALIGNAVSPTRPNRVEVLIEGKSAGSFEIPAGDWAFRPFGPIVFPAAKGDVHILLRPEKPPVTQPGDPRTLAVAIQNLQVTLTGVNVPCMLQP